MSDEHAKTVEPRPFNWGTPEKITVFFCVNLLAAYVPAVVCVMDLGLKENVALAYLISSVLFAGLITWSDAGGLVLPRRAHTAPLLGVRRLAQFVGGLGRNPKSRFRLLFVAGEGGRGHTHRSRRRCPLSPTGSKRKESQPRSAALTAHWQLLMTRRARECPVWASTASTNVPSLPRLVTFNRASSTSTTAPCS